MKTHRFIAAILVITLGLTAAAFSQNALTEFPVGTTRMVYEVISEDVAPQTIVLTVIGKEDGRYKVSMLTEAVGFPEELAEFGFLFGAASLQGAGRDLNYAALGALIDRRDRLEEGQEFLLPGGGTFTDIMRVTIAGISSIQGVFLDQNRPDSRMIMAFALTNPVFISPLIRTEEKRDGIWVIVFSIELVKYTFTAPEG